ncbi:hypothetical protein PIB30_088430 [Stylosanthes scabra]|uniref:Uncharacterized protein n=1 Tax=Stylosanthes scabra TaxID=79078 RepID=A0ABU6XT51_9FABA|nr:hypothetical protein [Stylosanthes scabra]
MRHFQRICVATTMIPFPFHQAPTNPDHSTNIPTHMRHFQCICVANSPSTPFNPLPVQYSHAYAYNPTHMRGTHIQNSIKIYPPTPRRPCLRLGVLLPSPHSPNQSHSLSPTHMHTTLRICVESSNQHHALLLT